IDLGDADLLACRPGVRLLRFPCRAPCRKRDGNVMDAALPFAVVGIAGWKNSGKTTLTERLVAALTARGHRVSTVKRAHHDADIDSEGPDSFRHRRAGAREVMLVTPVRWALMHEA